MQTVFAPGRITVTDKPGAYSDSPIIAVSVLQTTCMNGFLKQN